MDLHTGCLYWPSTVKNKIKRPTNPQHSEYYDAVIVGAGVSGALCAYTLANEGLKIAVIDKHPAGSGSSSANTGLLQFSNDIMLHKLIEQIGEEKAVRFYHLCKQAIDDLEVVSNALADTSEMVRRKSIYYASSEKDVPKLCKEFEVLKKYNFPVDFWSKDEVENHMPFSKPAALITYGDAEINPYLFVQNIMQYLDGKGVHIFENTEVVNVQNHNKGVCIKTSAGTFTASNIIYATGYETPPLRGKMGADINRSYAIATEPVDNLSEWEDQALIWETKRPYFYLRTTRDNRIIAGGLDEDEPEAPQNEDWIQNRAHRIKQEVEKLFPMMETKIAYAWGASFGESLDGLPFIGKHPDKEKVFYLLGYGGNGTVYSMLGSHIVRDLILGLPNEDAEIVKLDRN